MEIVSKPAIRTEPVIDVDFFFKEGTVKGFTLFESKGDSIHDDDDFIVLLLHDAGGEEVLTVYRDALAMRSVRHRTLEIPIDGPVIDDTGMIAQPALPNEEHVGEATV